MRSRGARTAAIAAIAALAVLGAAPAHGESVDHRRLWGLTRSPDGRLHVVRGDAAARAAVDHELGRSAAQVLTVEHDRPVRLLGTNDPLRSQQWALDQVSFEPAWYGSRGAGVIVAVVDTGVLASHEDLAGSVLGGIDYIDGTDGRIDPSGHGTHVAGIIAAHVGNRLGIAGAAPDARILPVRVLDANGSGVASNVAAGIIYATDHGARVINLSLGGGPSPGVESAMQYALSKQVLVFAAAGNNYQSGNQPVYPAAYVEAVAVAAVDSSLTRASFSNTGSYVDVAAPGVGILSSWGSSPTAYANASGTSMATPYASATAALVIAANPALSAASVRKIVESTARDLGAPGVDTWYGHGLVDPRWAVITALPVPAGYGTEGSGYWIVGADGRVRRFGDAPRLGDLRGVPISAMIVAAQRTVTGNGYWLAGADGAVYAFGDAAFEGGLFGVRLNAPIIGIAATGTGHGYYLLGGDGGVFAFGDARFYGSTGGRRLNAPVRDLAVTPSGHGYWLVAADGGVFAFGDARFYGSTGGMRLVAAVRSISGASDGSGYWIVAEDGGVFSFGVSFEGSVPVVRGLWGLPYIPSVRIRALSSGNGYYVLGADGSVYTFGTARPWGSATAIAAVDLMVTP